LNEFPIVLSQSSRRVHSEANVRGIGVSTTVHGSKEVTGTVGIYGIVDADSGLDDVLRRRLDHTPGDKGVFLFI
jgi:hypothetical protein